MGTNQVFSKIFEITKSKKEINPEVLQARLYHNFDNKALKGKRERSTGAENEVKRVNN